jgi:DNA-binding transcriptional MerR regulator
VSEILPDDRKPALLSARQIARIFGIDVRTLWNWEQADILIPATRIRGRRYYAVADVERLLGLGHQ